MRVQAGLHMCVRVRACVCVCASVCVRVCERVCACARTSRLWVVGCGLWVEVGCRGLRLGVCLLNDDGNILLMSHSLRYCTVMFLYLKRRGHDKGLGFVVCGLWFVVWGLGFRLPRSTKNNVRVTVKRLHACLMPGIGFCDDCTR